MPNYFTLTPKGGSEPANLCDVDRALCQHLNIPEHPRNWCRGWYDVEGMCLAMGKDWNWMRETFPEREAIITFLEANYNVNAWAMR